MPTDLKRHHVVQVVLPRPVADRLRVRAAEADRSLSAECRRLLIRSLEHDAAPTGERVASD